MEEIKQEKHCHCAEVTDTNTDPKKKMRPEDEKRMLTSRLNRIEGQIRGIKKMLENDAYCPDILVQVSAANAALRSFSKVLLSNHIKTCVLEGSKSGDDSIFNELCTLIEKITR